MEFDSKHLPWLVLPAAICIAAFVWLMIRFINRREKWTKRTLIVATITGIFGPALYLLALGPVVYFDSRDLLPNDVTDVLYYPLDGWLDHADGFPGEWFWDYYAIYLSWWDASELPAA
jgi:hypothetical protein